MGAHDLIAHDYGIFVRIVIKLVVSSFIVGFSYMWSAVPSNQQQIKVWINLLACMIVHSHFTLSWND